MSLLWSIHIQTPLIAMSTCLKKKIRVRPLLNQGTRIHRTMVLILSLTHHNLPPRSLTLHWHPHPLILFILKSQIRWKFANRHNWTFYLESLVSTNCQNYKGSGFCLGRYTGRVLTIIIKFDTLTITRLGDFTFIQASSDIGFLVLQRPGSGCTNQYPKKHTKNKTEIYLIQNLFHKKFGNCCFSYLCWDTIQQSHSL